MTKVCLVCQYCCGALKLITYSFCCCCLHKRREEKVEINVLVLGLQNSGKSYLLASLCGEPVDDIPSTNGFSIKDVSLPKTIIHMKEVGGSDKIKPYWSHYMGNAEGIIFVIDGSDLEFDNVDSVRSTLLEVMDNEQVAHKPLLLVITKVNPDECFVPGLIENLQLSDLNCSFIVEFSFSLPQLKETLQKYAENIALQKYADNLTDDEIRLHSHASRF